MARHRHLPTVSGKRTVDRRRHGGDRLRRVRGRRRDRGRPHRRDRRAGRPQRRRRADRRLRPGGAARRDRHARPLRGSRPHRARGLHHRHHVGRGRRHHDGDRAPAHLSAGHDRPALPREAGDGEAEGRHRLRPVGRADRALDPRDRGPVGARGRAASRPSCRSPTRPTRTSPTPSSWRGCARCRRSAASCWCTPRATRCCRPASRGCRRRAAATRWPTTSRGRRSSRRRPSTARSTWPRTPTCGSRSCTSPARSAPSSSRDEKRRGRPVTMEICPHHLLLDLDDLVRLGPYGMLRAGAARPRAGRAAVGARARRHRRLPRSPTTPPTRSRRRSRAGTNIFDALLGCQVIQETVPLVLDEAFHRRGMPLERSRASRRRTPARIAGLYPRKGTLLPGADADLALYDLDTEWIVDARASSSRRTRGRRSTGGACGRGSCARWCAARRCTRRRDPGRARVGPVPVLPRRLLAGRDRRRRRRADVFRLALLNPNTDEHHTEAMARRRARGAAGRAAR